MSELLRIVYEVAAVRRDSQQLHRRLFRINATRLVDHLARRDRHDSSADREQLAALRRRAQQALDTLASTTGEDLEVRWGAEIHSLLRKYTEALLRSLAAMDALVELRRSTKHDDPSPEANQAQSIKVAYDDSLQHLNRLGARLNSLIASL
jgi:hypothetical protein